ncbi:uncharacterized protein DS421_13g402060 [Arachis hypogaea]|nr:uncharacterized protein DS421_13g402060 [Arachis hypogaea]
MRTIPKRSTSIPYMQAKPLHHGSIRTCYKDLTFFPFFFFWVGSRREKKKGGGRGFGALEEIKNKKEDRTYQTQLFNKKKNTAIK